MNFPTKRNRLTEDGHTGDVFLKAVVTIMHQNGNEAAMWKNLIAAVCRVSALTFPAMAGDIMIRGY